MPKRVKRYTRLRKDRYFTCKNYIRQDNRDEYFGPAIDRLAEYEDTGLTPGQVNTLQKEAQRLRTEVDLLVSQVEDLEDNLSRTMSEREYFRSRAEFFREMAGRGKESA